MRYDGLLEGLDLSRSRVTFCEGPEMGLKNSYVSFRRTPLTWKYALGGVLRCGSTVEPPSSSAMDTITA